MFYENHLEFVLLQKFKVWNSVKVYPRLAVVLQAKKKISILFENIPIYMRVAPSPNLQVTTYTKSQKPIVSLNYLVRIYRIDKMLKSL